MRAIFVGASETTDATAKNILKHAKEVIIIEENKHTIEPLEAELNCGFILGCGSKPAILPEVEAGKDDTLYALTDNHQSNIITSLVGRSLGVENTIIKIREPELEHICLYRNESFLIPEQATTLLPDDEVVMIVHEKSLEKLKELYASKSS